MGGVDPLGAWWLTSVWWARGACGTDRDQPSNEELMCWRRSREPANASEAYPIPLWNHRYSFSVVLFTKRMHVLLSHSRMASIVVRIALSIFSGRYKPRERHVVLGFELLRESNSYYLSLYFSQSSRTIAHTFSQQSNENRIYHMAKNETINHII